MRYGGAELAAQILEEGDATKAGLFFSQDAGALGALAQGGPAAEAAAGVDQGRRRVPPAPADWVGTSARARVLAYNPDQAPEVAVDSVHDVLDPKWKGKIGFAPTNASFQAFVTALRVTEGEDGGPRVARGPEGQRAEDLREQHRRPRRRRCGRGLARPDQPLLLVRAGRREGRGQGRRQDPLPRRRRPGRPGQRGRRRHPQGQRPAPEAAEGGRLPALRQGAEVLRRRDQGVPAGRRHHQHRAGPAAADDARRAQDRPRQARLASRRRWSCSTRWASPEHHHGARTGPGPRRAPGDAAPPGGRTSRPAAAAVLLVPAVAVAAVALLPLGYLASAPSRTGRRSPDVSLHERTV